MKAILAIDQGTTSTRAIIFSTSGDKIFSSQLEFKQYFPKNGWVEHNPNEIWNTTLKVIKNVIKKCKKKKINIITIGITNQRETTVLWDKTNGKPVYNAIDLPTSRLLPPPNAIIPSWFPFLNCSTPF